MQRDKERLRYIAAKISSYDVAKTEDKDLDKLVLVHSKLDLNAPMPGCTPNQFRKLIFQGRLTLEEFSNSVVTQVDLYGFLMSDMLLLCKLSTKNQQQVRGRYEVTRQPFAVDKLKLMKFAKKPKNSRASIKVVYLNEYHTAVAAFCLFSNDEAINIKTWAVKIRKAQYIYKETKSVATRAVLAGMRHLELSDSDSSMSETESSASNICWTSSKKHRKKQQSRRSSRRALLESAISDILETDWLRTQSDPCLFPSSEVEVSSKNRESCHSGKATALHLHPQPFTVAPLHYYLETRL